LWPLAQDEKLARSSEEQKVGSETANNEQRQDGQIMLDHRVSPKPNESKSRWIIQYHHVS